MLSFGTSNRLWEHLYCLHGAGFTGGSCGLCSSFFASIWRETFLYQKKGITMLYRSLTTEGKRRACLGAKLRYARRRDEGRREMYLKILPRIRNPRISTLKQYGLSCVPEGYFDGTGTLVAERENSGQL